MHSIRKASHKDIPRVMELLHQVNMVHHLGRPDLFKAGTKYTADTLEELFQNPQRPVFVATDGEDKVLGYAFCIFQGYENDQLMCDIRTLYIDDLCVDEQMRGQHIGRELYEYVKQFAKDAGCYNVTLNVWSLNTAAQKFYESCGLKPQKVGMECIL
ncbi:MAG: GNAT family N-acetyltransferase [Clostridia bacterium]|nr:GNAT family N-acetyltransferase [Clostridia bacterium]